MPPVTACAPVPGDQYTAAPELNSDSRPAPSGAVTSFVVG